MKSDVIRKRARHDARRGAGNGSSETPPSASPGASRRASPNAESTPTLAPDSSTQLSYNGGGNEGSPHNNGGNMEFRGSMQSELMGALGSSDLHYNNQLYSTSYFPGPYHPDVISQLYTIPNDALPFASSGDTSDADSVSESRASKRRRMSNDSASEPPSSAVSFSSYSDSFTSASSSTSHSQRSSVDFPYTPYSSFNMLRGGSWHPPMLPPDGSPGSYVHPPMLPGDDNSPMFFTHQPMVQGQDDTDALFAFLADGASADVDADVDAMRVDSSDGSSGQTKSAGKKKRKANSSRASVVADTAHAGPSGETYLRTKKVTSDFLSMKVVTRKRLQTWSINECILYYSALFRSLISPCSGSFL